jgi:LmbE family N-acetylglucosaminyl deacetylase
MHRKASTNGIHADASTVVFAPHQDDETLGCGGTIRMKRQAGTEVQVVFMTDGSTSHRQFIDAAELSRLRAREAIEALAVLGVPESAVAALGYPDGRLAEYHSEAVEKVLAIVEQCRPREVFVPYRCDGTADHEATHQIVVAALKRSGLRIQVCEYPVWFWNQWPWVSLRFSMDRPTVQALWRATRHRFGFTALREFGCRVPIRDHLEIKKQALVRHRTQTCVLRPGVGWPVLADVSGGEFLNCFYQDSEWFHCWETISQKVSA